ncbi:MAG: nth [Gammaproteobacteria bacterium]|jgi:endonuclease-3|nr:nth [Gammaproteobacteria bacterium]
MNPQQCYEIFYRFMKQMPEPVTELIYNSPFELLIAVILSANATDKSVNKATKELYPVANTPEAIFKLGEDQLKTYIKSVNLSNTKAKNIIKTCQILIEQHHGQIPNSREALEALAGVGRKTANVVLNVIFREPTMAVDTHIFRVSNRTGIAPGKTPLAVERALVKIVPQEFMLHAHHWLILHGRYTCIARKPKCPECIIKDLCEYPDKTGE